MDDFDQWGQMHGNAYSEIAAGRSDALFDVLGPHNTPSGRRLTCFAPSAVSLSALVGGSFVALERDENVPEIFSGTLPARGNYELVEIGRDGSEHRYLDPYAFGPVMGAVDLYLLGEGTHGRLWEVLGAHACQHMGAPGVHFAVWAPNARRVSVIGEFNQWDGRRHVMRRAGNSGFWEIFLPGLGEGEVYKYEILTQSNELLLKADPLAFGAQHPPETASIIRDIRSYGWCDDDWMAGRAACNSVTSPISIYEVHMGSWRRIGGGAGRSLSYAEAAEELVKYVADMGFTHLELLPVHEHPFGGSWGYQPTGLYAPTVRFGPPQEFRDLVDAAHRSGLGVILDWVPGHFPSDPHGLVRFDGTALYEHEDPKEGYHVDWNTLIYNFGRTEVANFLIANARFWLSEYHVDGLRVDAVASMLYRDYSRADGQWIPNRDGGRENYEAISLLRRMNRAVYADDPSVMTIAEESTDFDGVTRPVHEGGLGFGFKWNMGWMNDSLDFICRDPIHRKHHHGQLTFGLVYAFAENFVLPISHDEVVHGKGSMLAKMPGSASERFANLRAFYGFMWGHPGKKLLFMGQEFAQPGEWNHDGELDWHLLDDPRHDGVRKLIGDLNSLYRENPALHRLDADPRGFEWVDVDAADASVFSWLRFSSEGEPCIAVVCNFTPIERSGWQLGLPAAGEWREVLNTDAVEYGGSGSGNLGLVVAIDRPASGKRASATVTLPPLSVLFLRQETST